MKRTFFSYTPNFQLQDLATQSGVHQLAADIYGQRYVLDQFPATAGEPLKIPNIFPEQGSYKIRVFQPDGTEYPFPDECGKKVRILYACSGDIDYMDC